MTITEIKNIIEHTGKPLTVQFTDKINEWFDDCCPDPLMKAKLVITKDEECEGEKSYKLIFNMSEFVDFNKSVAIPNYYDKNNNPTLTWFESSFYPKNNVYETCYDDHDKDVEIFKIIPDEDNENYFVKEIKKNKNNHFKTDLDILNWYRNLYYKEESDTEQGIMARAINGLFMSLKNNGIETDKINTNIYQTPFDK